MDEPRSRLEEAVVERVYDGRDELVGLVTELVACDTTARKPGDPPRDEVKLQGVLAARLAALGAAVDVWEPEPTGRGNRFVPDDLDFAGRPQLAALLQGAGGGPSLLLNGHIDAVTPGPVESWASDPFRAEARDGVLYGRGVNDMKGGLASLLFALDCLQRAGAKLRGDVVYCANTDEESSGAGSLACIAHGVRADAGICAEPTDFDAWVTCRGTVCPIITVPGRAGHAEEPPAHWSEGGPVNAIEKARVVLDAIKTLREEWRGRADKRHPLLAPGDIVPTIIEGGVWVVTYPPSCTITCDAQYLPGDLDEENTGRAVEREIIAWIDAAAQADPWLREHPLQWEWMEDVVPGEMPADHPLVQVTLAAGAGHGRRGKVAGLNSWHDAAHFSRSGTPTFSYGVGGLDTAHAIDECVPVDDLVDCCAIVALAAMRWCGVTG